MGEPRITPLARRLAEENGIDWRRLQGTGPDGAIVERDILAYLARVMAGEVDLPPMPEEPPPLPPAEELKRAQEALGREGVDLADLLPKPPASQAEEALDLEPALLEDLELEEEALLLAEELPPEPAPEPWPLEEEGSRAPSPLAEEMEALLAEEGVSEAPGAEGPPRPFPEEEWSEEDLFLEEDLAGSLLPQPLEEALSEGEAPLVAALQKGSSEQAPAAWATPVALWVWRRRVDLAGLEGALAAFARAHGVPETPLPFLVRAAERALAELELPLRPLLARVEGEGVRGLRPRGGFLALFAPVGEEGEEGLLCFAGEEEVHTGRPSLFLSPEGVLAASGLEGPVAQRLLERVALYLENPVLLLA
ncbi:E3 binding domain-containing protein [Thermus thermamylovorans]|uniref:Dihydrolipoamide acyltransferase n=1 Tax=Thermus thermamylovorans TaxID=2509362 RepID=A0A4Q9AZI2_9DEIN|nr:E3 binding domain-containing protein [Thermus thermamylovorans]TBH17523.1 dihydrolipoamide acyltransferase [Thermus thermamylovorans]